MYSILQYNKANDARYPNFSKLYQCKDLSEQFAKKFNNFIANNLPPSKAELHLQLLKLQ